MRVIFYILKEITAARCEKRKEFVHAVALWKKNYLTVLGSGYRKHIPPLLLSNI